MEKIPDPRSGMEKIPDPRSGIWDELPGAYF
jgi:hypothetical protein